MITEQYTKTDGTPTELEIVETLGHFKLDIVQWEGELNLRIRFNQDDYLTPITENVAAAFSRMATHPGHAG